MQQKLKYIFFGIAFLLRLVSFGQDLTPKNGVATSTGTVALTDVKIIVKGGQTIEKGTMIVENGIIKEVGKLIPIPKNAIKIDLKGYTIYPSFVEIHGSEGIRPLGIKKEDFKPQINSLKTGPYYWNQAIHPEVNAVDYYSEKVFKEKQAYKKAGFGSISTHQRDGILRGTSVLMTLSNNKGQEDIILSTASNHYSFSKGSSKQTYPSSQMGAIALIRQFFYDAKWYQSLPSHTQENLSLKKGLANLNLPQIFEVSNKLEVLRAVKIAKEFGMDLIIKSGGDSYERINEIKATGAKLIVPVNFPAAFDVTDPYLSRFVSLADLKDWEMKPYNAYFIHKKEIPFCFTTAGLKKKENFIPNIRKAIKSGLPKDAALKALTENPAKFLNVSDKIGTLEPGKIANFLVVKGDLFEDGEIYENWARGDRMIIKDISNIDIRGTYNLNINKVVYNWKIEGTAEKPKAKIESFVWRTDSVTQVRSMDTLKIKPTLTLNDLQLSMSFNEIEGNMNGVIQLNGTYNPSLAIFHGKALLPNGEWADWSAIRGEKHTEKKKKEQEVIDTASITNIYYPNMAYGFDSLPEKGIYFIKNATLWTNEENGILKNATLLIKDGKIQAVNKGVVKIPNDAIIIDGTGKHVTSGIIDEHSHIAISKGVNESGQAVSAEVSIGDVVRSNDINIYRQLSGGVTASQLLHGSANPIGGQSALIKLKWGFTPEEMLIKNKDGFIKFALGENVKQSNWGDFNTVRFPQTRMGVEQVFYDAFIKAKTYQAEWDLYNGLSEKKKIGKIAPRVDLEMETINEILRKERFISCHSYIQSEINMLMHVADSMGFTLNTFTHILEGYKVAEKMKAHGAGASTFADWWAYKYEVNDAIPYNAAILHKMGIVTAINSDDAEMGRRLNQEAAKIVKYGGVSEEDAWKMVTLNPAILLHLDDQMGSLKEGKDADIVIWSHNPLSIQAKVEQTFVDGMLLYDINRSVELHDRDQEERKRIMALMLEAKANGASTKSPYKKLNPHYHCDSEGE